jgi:hypothetical protein
MTTVLLILGGVAIFLFVTIGLFFTIAMLGYIELTNPEDLDEDGSE